MDVFGAVVDEADEFPVTKVDNALRHFFGQVNERDLTVVRRHIFVRKHRVVYDEILLHAFLWILQLLVFDWNQVGEVPIECYLITMWLLKKNCSNYFILRSDHRGARFHETVVDSPICAREGLD